MHIFNQLYTNWFLFVILFFLPSFTNAQNSGSMGTRKYKDFERPRACASCHRDFFQQYRQAMMSQAYTHHWDEIEYFQLALPHSERNPKLTGIKTDCNGCHAPLAFLSGDVPPQPPEKKSRANESISCDFCHTIKGKASDLPFNFNYISTPGITKFGPRKGTQSPHHKTKKSDFKRQTFKSFRL